MDAHYNNETSNWQRFHSKLHFQLSSAFLRYFHEICNITPCIIVLRDRVKIHLILRVFFFTFMLYMRVVVKKMLFIERWNVWKSQGEIFFVKMISDF